MRQLMRAGSVARTSDRETAWSCLVLGLTLICSAGCREAEREPFYQPPTAQASMLESAESSCIRWSEITRAAASSTRSTLETALVQQLLPSGFDELRADPVEPAQGDGAQHLSASIRGAVRDSVLVISLAPPFDKGHLAPWLAVARSRAEGSTPAQQPTGRTQRFAILPSGTGLEPASVVPHFLSQRPRVLDLIQAVVVLEPTLPAPPAASPDQSTWHDWTTHPGIARRMASAGLTPPPGPAPSIDQLEGLTSALATADLPLVVLPPPAADSSCDRRSLEAIEAATVRLDTVLEALASL